MPNADFDSSQNPYRSPTATDEGDGNMTGGHRKRARDLALVGLFVGLGYGAAAGTAITVSVDVFHTLVQVWTEPGPFSVSGRIEEWITYYVAVAALGAVLGAFNGAVLGHAQGWVTAHRRSVPPRRLQVGAAFCWASVAAVWCLLIDQNALSSGPPAGMLYVALVVAPSAAGCVGVLVAKRLT